MKWVVILVILIAIIVGAWFGISSWNRARILNSGRVVLLINEGEGQYTFSDAIPRDDIDRSWKIAGFADELNDAELNEKTQGLRFGAELDSSFSGRLPKQQHGDVQAPSEEQSPGWTTIVNSLTQEQLATCGQVPVPSLSQYCVSRHHIFNSIKQGRGVEACEGIFIDLHKAECEELLASGNLAAVPDNDNNQLLDNFQIYAGVNTDFVFQQFQQSNS